jgi:hypothetical protein
VSRLRSTGALVTFRISPGTSDIAVLPTSEYTAEVDKWLDGLRRQEGGSGEAARISSDPKIQALSAFRDAVPSLGRLPTISMNALIDAVSGRGGYVREATGADGSIRQRIR